MPGVGKTTIGALVAERESIPFIDLDREIEQRSGKSITQIFAEDGEREFRKLEAALLADACEEYEGVIALGAGAIEQTESFELVMLSGTLVYLRASLDLLVERNLQITNRPLLADSIGRDELRDKLSTLLSRRKKRYMAAPVVVDILPDDTANAVATRIIEELRWRGGA